MIGVAWWGATGAAAAVAVVAGVVVLPLYLQALAGSGVPAATIGRHAVPPLVATTVLGLVLVAMSTILTTDLALLAVGGVLTAAVIGTLLWTDRALILALRRPHAEATA